MPQVSSFLSISILIKMPIANRKIYEKVAEQLGMSADVVQEVYQNYWKCLKEKIEEVPLCGILSKEEFDKYCTVFGIPRIGKIYCLYDNYIKRKTFYKKLKENEKHKSEKDNPDMERDCDDC